MLLNFIIGYLMPVFIFFIPKSIWNKIANETKKQEIKVIDGISSYKINILGLILFYSVVLNIWFSFFQAFLIALNITCFCNGLLYCLIDENSEMKR